MIHDDLKLLETTDLYSLSMFMLYKLIDDPEYITLSELPYVIDRKDLISLCTVFGGQTIKIPTLEELYSVLHVLLLYQYVHLDGIPFDDAIKKVGYEKQDIRNIRRIYNKLSKVLSEYDFKHRN